MKNQLRRLKALEKMIDLNMFYSISATPNELSLQGAYKPSLVVALRALEFNNWSINDSGYSQASRGHVEVTLT